MIEFKTRENDTHVEVALAGGLTIREAREAFDHVQPVWQKSKTVIFNLGGVTDLDTMGFQLLLYWKTQAKARQQKLHYVNHSTSVLAALDLFGAVAALGDKIKLSAADRERFAFAYGVKRN